MAGINYNLKVDWDDDGDYGDTGEDLQARLLRWELRRGRDFPSQLTGKSTAARFIAIVNNESGDYSPFNTSSPLAGSLVPGHKMRLGWWQDTGFPYTFPFVFSDAEGWVGYLESIAPVPSSDRRHEARLEGIGPLGYLNQDEIEVAMQSSVRVDQAVTEVLDAAGWATADRDLDTANTTLTRWWVRKRRVMQALRELEDTESGFILEARDGKIAFKKRRYRLEGNSLTSQATFTDAPGGTLTYREIEEEDPIPQIFNTFMAEVILYTVASIATLWTNPENKDTSPASSPLILAGETLTFYATYPNPQSATDAIAVDAWTTPVATTDTKIWTSADGTGTELTSSMTITVAAADKKANEMKIQITNGSASDGYVTELKARGTVVTQSDPVRVKLSDTTSQTDYGQRAFPSRAVWIPDTAEARDWAGYNLSRYKDPVAILRITVVNKDSSHRHQVLTRDIGDRITIVATGAAGIEVNEDFFIESEIHRADSNGVHQVTWDCSPASVEGGFWIMGVGVLGSTTKLAY